MAMPPKPWPEVKPESGINADTFYNDVKIVKYDYIRMLYHLADGTIVDAKVVHEDWIESSFVSSRYKYKTACAHSYKATNASEPKMFEAPKKTRETLAELKKVFNVDDDKPGLLEADKAADKTIKAFKEALPSPQALIIDQQKKTLKRLDEKQERELKESIDAYSKHSKLITYKSDQVKFLRGSEEDNSVFMNNGLILKDVDVEVLDGFQGKDIIFIAEFPHRKIINRSNAKIEIHGYVSWPKGTEVVTEYRSNFEIEAYNGSIDIKAASDINIYVLGDVKSINVSSSKNVTIKVYKGSPNINVDGDYKDVSVWFYGDFKGTITRKNSKELSRHLSFSERVSFFPRWLIDLERKLLFPNENPIHDIL